MAEWTDRDQVPDDPEGISLTREMMTVFKEEESQIRKEDVEIY